MDGGFQPKPPESPSAREKDFTHLINARNFSPAVKALLKEKVQKWTSEKRGYKQTTLLLAQAIGLIISKFSRDEDTASADLEELSRAIDAETEENA